MCTGETKEVTCAACAVKVVIPGVDDEAIEDSLIQKEARERVERYKPGAGRPLSETAWKCASIAVCELGWTGMLVVPFLDSGLDGLPTQVVAFVVGTLVVDLIGILTHFFFDNYGNKDTWLLGGIIETFDHHHVRPYSAFGYDHVDLVYIEKTYALGVIATAWAVGALRVSSTFSLAVWSAVLFWGGNIPLIHKAAHTANPDEPWASLQRWGVLIDKKYHSYHHRNLSSKHSLVCGYMDSVCEKTGFIPLLEVICYLVFGAVANHSQLGLTSKALDRPLAGRMAHVAAHVRSCIFA